MVLSRVSSFVCEPGDWDNQGFAHLMGAICSNETIGHLTIELPLLLFTEENNLARESLQNMLTGNNTIENADFNAGYVAEEVFPPGDDCLAAVLASLVANTSILDATLRRFCLSNSRSLAEFMSNCRVPKLKLESITIDIADAVGHYFAFDVNDCNIQHLQLRNDLRDTWCNQMIRKLDGIPNLRELCLGHISLEGDLYDVSEPLMASIGKEGYQGKLYKLTLENTVIDLDSLTATLRNNTLLQELDITKCNENNYGALLGCVADHIENHSTTLSCVHTKYSSDDDDEDDDDVEIPKELGKIDFLVALNRFGRRGKAMSDKTTLPQFVGLLCDVVAAPHSSMLDDHLERFHGDHKHNIQFGLLRLTPHLWSSSAG
eukprot:Sro2370_g325180.1 n/a (375) ;mRNA; r:4104-5228